MPKELGPKEKALRALREARAAASVAPKSVSRSATTAAQPTTTKKATKKR